MFILSYLLSVLKPQSKDVAKKSFKVIDDITEVIFSQKVAGEEQTVITTKLISITLDKQEAERFGDRHVGEKTSGQFKLPPSDVLLRQSETKPDVLLLQVSDQQSIQAMVLNVAIY